MNLLGSSKNNISKETNGENAPRPEITEVILVRCNIANRNIFYLFKNM